MLDNYRTLVALRYAAESVDEVNVFLARALEMQVRSQFQGALERAAGFAVACATAVVSGFAIGGELFAPAAWALGIFFFFLTAGAVWRVGAIWKQQSELTTDHKSVKDYLAKATRDREQNRVAVAIQNRKAAAIGLVKGAGLDVDEKKFLTDSIEYWGRRLQERRAELEASKNTDVWKGHEMLTRLNGWIDAEFAERPPA